MRSSLPERIVGVGRASYSPGSVSHRSNRGWRQTDLKGVLAHALSELSVTPCAGVGMAQKQHCGRAAQLTHWWYALGSALAALKPGLHHRRMYGG